MKYILSLIFTFITLAASAQVSALNETQKQEALQAASKFCNLFSRWCNGERTLDTQVYNLCSGSDCSAYDEVVNSKETTMRNYMLAIQKKYAKKLAVQVSAPSLSNSSVRYEPALSLTSSFQDGASDIETIQVINAKVESYNNAYVIFDVTVSIPSLNKNVNKKVIYDYNAKRITAFVMGQGTFISYINGMTLMAEGSYREAIQQFDVAASNNRASLKKSSYSYAWICSGYLNDFTLMRKYAIALGDKFLVKYMDAADKIVANQFPASIPDWKECERMALADKQYAGFLPTVYLELGIAYSLPKTESPYYNPELSVDYFRKAIAGGNVQAAQFLFRLYMTGDDNDFDDYVTDEEIMRNLEWAASQGHSPSIFMLGNYYEVLEKDYDEARKWYMIGCEIGNALIMAKLGRMLINRGGSYVAEGKQWIRKALEGNTLEKNIAMYASTMTDGFWPQNRADVERLLGGTSTSSSTPAAPASPATPATSYSSASTSSSTQPATTSTYSNTTSYTAPSNSYSYRRKYHEPFNHAVDEFFGGLSVGYIQKQWVYDDGTDKEKVGLFDDDKYMSGIQAGIRVDPQFGGGFGVNSGLFYEYCWGKSDEQMDEYGTYHFTYEEHGLYLPLHLKFTMNFSKWFQLSVYGGAGLNYVIAGNLYLRDGDETYDSEDAFSEEEDMSRFNFMLEYGASLRINALQFDFSMSRGLNNWSDTKGMKITQNRPFNITMTYCF